MPAKAGEGAGGAPTRVERLATPAEVASYLQVPVKTLYTWRYKRVGPCAHRVGRHLRYRWEDVEDWLASTTLDGMKRSRRPPAMGVVQCRIN
jgi:excisionase family DNA binding protein